MPQIRPPSKQQIITKAVFELIACAIFGVAFLVIHNREPFQRGFYCDDETILHPYTEAQKCPAVAAGIIWVVALVAIVAPVELFRSCQITRPPCPLPVPWIVLDVYRVLGHFVQGGLATVLITEVAKVSIGRLRPHFLSLCKPNLDLCQLSSDDNDDNNQSNKFVGTTKDNLEAVCTSFDLSRAGKFNLTETSDPLSYEDLQTKMNEARLSFMSGHTSTSFYAALFLILYLQARLDNCQPGAGVMENVRIGLKAFRPLVQACLMSLALWVSFSRISDYFHHPLDVAVGALVGILMAFVTVSFARLFQHDQAFGRFYPDNNRKVASVGNRSSHKPGADPEAPKTGAPAEAPKTSDEWKNLG